MTTAATASSLARVWIALTFRNSESLTVKQLLDLVLRALLSRMGSISKA